MEGPQPSWQGRPALPCATLTPNRDRADKIRTINVQCSSVELESVLGKVRLEQVLVHQACGGAGSPTSTVI